MISLMVINEITSLRTLTAAVTTTGKLTHLRDPETGSHLDRMSRYSRLIANTLAKGREIIDDILENFGLEHIQHMDVLRNIAEYHHEAINGSGYPSGIKGNDIPLEARIVAVADVFDALTSVRPYKEAWTNEKAIETLKQLAGETLDQDCVNALVNNMERVEDIQQQFNENLYT